MHSSFLQRAEARCPTLLKAEFGALLAPIEGACAGGRSLRASGVYQAIAQARKADDQSLPMGGWERELKRADWDVVSQMAVDALTHQSKDLQLAGWLLEAQINKHGFAALASVLCLLEQLCARYWDELHPLAADGNLEHRANIFRWINDKLPPALRQVPVTAAGRGQEYSYADWERARRHEQLRHAGHADGAPEGVSAAELGAAIAATPSEALWALESDLADARAALAALAQTITRQFADEAPGLGGFAGALEQSRGLVEQELHRRGARRPEPPADLAETVPAAPLPVCAPDTGPIANRADAYARLSQAADYLLQLEPHSPAPYLVRRACEWGQLNAADLYLELFIRLNGQLNIFELLGLDAQAGGQHSREAG